MSRNCSIGIDIATENARVVLLSEEHHVLFRQSHQLSPVQPGANGALVQDPNSWVNAVTKLLESALIWARDSKMNPSGAVISATSGTFVIVDELGVPIMPAIMYNDRRGNTPLQRAASALSSMKLSTSSLRFAHTPEFVISTLLSIDIDEVPTDWSHALKTGVELSERNWSAVALTSAEALNLALPQVVSPGTLIGEFDASSWGLAPIPFFAGMTDGCTGQISAGGAKLGNCVTTLGTTLVLKNAAKTPISGSGFYSHLATDSLYLVGAASNLGGDSLHKHVTKLDKLESAAKERGLSTVISYPLRRSGERFPISDSTIEPFWSAKPIDEVDEYLSILEGVAFAERLSYEILNRAGADISGDFLSVGGGTKSALWNEIRCNVLNRELRVIPESGSDIGAAILAQAAKSEQGLHRTLTTFEVRDYQKFEPIPKLSTRYNERYLEFKELVREYL